MNACAHTRVILYRDTFSENKLIYVPQHDDHYWASRDECVWDAPQPLLTKRALKQLYAPLLPPGGADSAYLAGFFKDALGITDCTWKNLISELEFLCQWNRFEDVDKTTGIYTALDACRRGTDCDGEAIR